MIEYISNGMSTTEMVIAYKMIVLLVGVAFFMLPTSSN